MSSLPESKPAVRQRTTWRFRVPFGDTPNVLSWPAGAVPIHAELVPGGDQIDIWASVPDPEAPSVAKPFLLTGTGHKLPHQVEHIASMLQPSSVAPEGRFVWHLWHNPAQGLASQTWQNGLIVESRPA